MLRVILRVLLLVMATAALFANRSLTASGSVPSAERHTSTRGGRGAVLCPARLDGLQTVAMSDNCAARSDLTAPSRRVAPFRALKGTRPPEAGGALYSALPGSMDFKQWLCPTTARPDPPEPFPRQPGNAGSPPIQVPARCACATRESFPSCE